MRERKAVYLTGPRDDNGGGQIVYLLSSFFTNYNRNPDIAACRWFLMVRGISLIYLLSVPYINE
jgi:hypothetical protein